MINDLIVEKYNEGLSINQISILLNVGRKKVSYTLKKENIVLRSRGEANKLRQRSGKDLLDLQNSNDLYWLGMLATDGWLTANTRIGLELKDELHIKEFKNWSKSNNKILTRNRDLGISYSFAFSNMYLYEQLVGLGITERKSFTLKVKNSLLLTSKDFWRGAVDGDGSLSWVKGSSDKRYPGFNFGCGSKLFVEQFVLYAQEIVRKSITLHKKKNQELYYISLRGMPAVRLIEELYGEQRFSLHRKQIIANDMIDYGRQTS